jgi:hypothetical protein
MNKQEKATRAFSDSIKSWEPAAQLAALTLIAEEIAERMRWNVAGICNTMKDIVAENDATRH